VSATAIPPACPPIFPKALSPGDTIEIVAPAGYLNAERISLAKKRLEEMGFVVRLGTNLFRKRGYLAGSDEERAQELMRAFADPQVKAIFPGTGGYGATRIVDKLDYAVIQRNPKILIGFSDITALHVAINQRTGLVSFHSPNPEWGLGSDDNLPPIAAKWFWRALLKNNRDSELPGTSPLGYAIHITPTDLKATKATTVDSSLMPTTLHQGKARGRLIGGNLSVIHALMGTPFEIQTDGRILVIEDIGEAPYRVDRMLNSLRLAGKFDRPAGVILGQFTARQGDTQWGDEENMDDVISQYFAHRNFPVVANYPLGHVASNVTLPVGVLTELDADRQTLQLLENPVR